MSNISKMKKLLDTTLPQVSDFPTKITRNSGGSTRKNSPFVSGGLIFYLLTPSALGQDTKNDTSQANTKTSNSEIGQIFHCSAENFTPHTRSITTNTVPGLFGIKSSHPTTQDISTTFSITMREWTNMPILKTLRSWQNLIFDANHGISLATDHLDSNFKGDAIVMYIKPNFQRKGSTEIAFTKDMVEEMFWYTGVFPTSGDIPASDISAPDLQTIPVTFSFDGHPFTMENDTMLDKAVALITSYTDDINKVTSTSWFKMDTNSGNVDTAFGENP